MFESQDLGNVKSINKEVMVNKIVHLFKEMSEEGKDLCSESSYEDLKGRDKEIYDEIKEIKRKYIGKDLKRIEERLAKFDEEHEELGVGACFGCWMSGVCSKCYEIGLLSEDKDFKLKDEDKDVDIIIRTFYDESEI